jgi:uncharacterized membrane protein YoaT (DUF817 family)
MWNKKKYIIYKVSATRLSMRLPIEIIDVIIWLHENRTEGCSVNAMDMAAEN